jgi:hypothetical protein
MFNLEEANNNMECLIDWIEGQQAMGKQFPSFNPDVDVDEPVEVDEHDPCNGRVCNECEIGGCEHNA